MENIISKRYDGAVYGTGPIKFTDIVNNKGELVHKAAYNDALNRLLRDLDTYDYSVYDNKYKDIFEGENGETQISECFTRDNIMTIIELPYSEYWMSPNVMIIFKILNCKNNSKRYLFIKKYYDLRIYWGLVFDKYERKSINVKVTKEDLPDVKISHFDYYRGKATMSSRQEEIDYDVDFDLLNHEDKTSEDAKLPQDLFVTQLRTM